MLYRFSLMSILLISSLCVHSTNTINNNPAFIKTDLGNGTVEYQVNTIKSLLGSKKSLTRTETFPTQLFNFTATAPIAGMTCQDLVSQINQLFIGKILSYNFFLYGLMTCVSLPDNMGQTINVHGFFDPIDNASINIALRILNDVNGFNFYGTPIQFEDSKALVFQLMTQIGRMNSTQNITVSKTFFTSAKYSGFYEASEKMLDVIRNSFDPTHEEIIIPMISRLFGTAAADTANNALRAGNAIELFAMPTFLYKDGLRKFPGALGFEVFRGVCGTGKNATCLPPKT